MKLLRMTVTGLNLYDGKELDINLTTIQRIANKRDGALHEVSPKVYKNNIVGMIGLNASGKTSTLKIISFVMNLLDNQMINSIFEKGVLNELFSDKVIIKSYFADNESKNIYLLDTTIEKNSFEEFVITEETLYTKTLKSIRSKKEIFHFTEQNITMKRENDAEFLLDEISIISAYNKKNKKNKYLIDALKWTNFNILRTINIPIEIINYFDSSVEFLTVEREDNVIFLRLKFKGKEVKILRNFAELENYLSSGTIKGINIFIGATIALKEGSLFIIDEIENHFNKEIVRSLLRLFSDETLNEKGATIIFTTHYPELLDDINRNDAIFIVRNTQGVCVENLSDLLTRNDFKKSEIYQSNYLGGTAPSYKKELAMRSIIKRIIGMGAVGDGIY